MSKICPRCGRLHSGVCGIPGNGVMVASGTTGVRAVRGRTPVMDSYSVTVEPKKPKQRTRLTKSSLEELLDWGMEQERKMVEMIKVLPSEMPEYQQLLERLDKIVEANRQVRVQIALRRG